MVILDLWGISFHPVVVVGLGNDLFFQFHSRTLCWNPDVKFNPKFSYLRQEVLYNSFPLRNLNFAWISYMINEFLYHWISYLNSPMFEFFIWYLTFFKKVKRNMYRKYPKNRERRGEQGVNSRWGEREER